jgi:hypothetical protein
MHPARLTVEELMKEVRSERTRGSGPGGQHRNRVETAMRLTHLPTGIRGAASERRTRKDNEAMAVRRLRLNLALQHRTPLTDARFVAPGNYEPSELWLTRVRARKIAVNVNHRDFPALLAEALDLLDVYEDDMDRASTALRISKTQLVKFLAKEPAALAALNQRRKQAGKSPYR